MALCNTLNSSQPNAGAFKRLRRVETLEYTEQFTYILHIKSDSIVSNEHDYLILLLVHASYFDLGLRARAREFYCVRNQIDEREPEHGAVSIAGGQATNSPIDMAPLGVLPNFGQSFFHKLFQADHRLVGLSTAYSGKGEKVVDQVAHPLRRL